MLVAFSVAPSTVDNPDASMHAAGLPNRTAALVTTLEGDWDEVMDVVKRATKAVAEHSPRVSLVLKADIRPGHTGEITGKVERVEALLAQRQDSSGAGA